MLLAHGVTKTFPGVKSLDRVDFEARAGEILALVGENGAGKSTLIKVIAGAYQPDEGELVLDGRKVRWSLAARGARRRHLRHLPGARALPRALHRPQHLHRQRAARPAGPDRPWRDAPRGAPPAGRAGRRPRSRPQGQDALGRRPADGRDRPGAGRAAPGFCPGRAHGRDRRPRGHAALQDDAAGGGAGCRRRLHLAPPRGGVRDRRPGDRPARTASSWRPGPRPASSATTSSR